ncbi:MAG TPA: GAF domain-containing protein, partial [Bryobacteraceae bacterium]|nr:GAF domain-containing protein [Bryobacteraceae bacterium]
MEAEIEQAVNEIKRLKDCINNLISVQALPAIWSGGQPSQIVSALLDMLLEMLSLDFAYARLKDSTGGAPLEMARFAQDRNLTAQPQTIGRALHPWLGDFPHVSPSLVRNPIGDGDVSVLLLRLGLQAEMGVFVAGSKRADFPTQTERLLLNVAANQAAIGLQEARLLSEQKRVAQELDQRVAQRTSQLLAANEELEKEIAERKRAEEKLRGSEAFLAEGQRISRTGTWSWNVASGKVTWSEEHYRIFGFDPEKTKPSFQLFMETVHPEDRSFIKQELDEAIRERRGFDLEFRLKLPDGAIKHAQGVGRPTLGPSGEVDSYVGTTVDISERKRGEALFAGEKRLLEMIATGVPLEEILNVLCLIIEDYRPGALASILLLRSDGLHLDSVAGPSLPKEWRQEMEKLPIGPCAGSCGTAAYRGSAVIVSDIATDPLWDVPEHRAAALSHGLRASWSNPILSSERNVLGTFCIYERTTRSPNSHDLEVIEKATYLARVAIERDRAEAALRTSEEKYRDLINASPDAVCVLDADSKFVLANPAGVELAGRPEEELIGSSVTNTYVPEELHLFRDRIEKLKAEGSFRFERKFRRKNGEVIPVEVSLAALRGQYYQAIIRDISQRKRREALLAGENRVLEMVAKGDSLAEILDKLCVLVEEQSSGVLASILLMDPNGKQLRHGAAPNLPKTYTEAIDGAFIGPAVGSCGTAAYRAEQVIVSDIAADPLWADFRDLALAHSLRACWSTPIFSSEGKVIGTFAMYYREPRSPSPREQETIKHITYLA